VRTELDRSRFPFTGSLLMVGCGRDEYGLLYQVVLKLRPGGWGAEDLVRDDHGRALAWVFGEDGKPRSGSKGAPLPQVPPADVSDAAERWLSGQQQTE
jgi:hypothetical protein